ncbi:hypothetical protein C8J57DRAFT_1719512 [Mycena rebaudengoi]|nr:hypothetical protein C8J57DRAFT_1719512 [Mycena rebaudengoi]
MNYTIDASAFSSHWDLATVELYETLTEGVLYGISLVLFALSGYILHNRKSAGRRTLALTTCAMAVLATLQFAMRIQSTRYAFQIFRLAIQGDEFPSSPKARLATASFVKSYFSEDILLVTNNFVTDGLFIYRSFLIWGRNIYVVVAPIIMLCATTVLGYIVSYTNDYSDSERYLDARAVFIITLSTNTLLMALTAGRIWWMSRDARIVLGSKFVRKYDMVIEIILESGAIYCICIVIYVICASIPTVSPILLNIFRGAIPQIMNIAPTLIIVRVGLSHNTEGYQFDAGRPSSRPLVRRPASDQLFETS